MAHDTEDDGFHEIQLNGKQLVFLFMAATVISVVIFLCGVLVGRNVRERSIAVADEAASGSLVADATPQPATAAMPPVGSDPTTAAPPPTVDDLSYFDRLEKKGQPSEQLKTGPATTATRPVEPPPARAAVPEPTQAAPVTNVTNHVTNVANGATVAPRAPAGPLVNDGAPAASTALDYAIQVAALREHNEADVIARRLNSKGYDAYVITPPSGTPVVYRVRVGKFKTRHEAETVASKLQREEQFKPWITR